MQKILAPIDVGATTDGSLGVEGVERRRAAGREIVFKKHKAEGVGSGFAENLIKPAELGAKNESGKSKSVTSAADCAMGNAANISCGYLENTAKKSCLTSTSIFTKRRE